jgi:Fur family transcriptional regulator, ferric uptake regulator
MLLTQHWLDRLQASNYRLTGSRRVVVEVVAQSEYILSPMDIYLKAIQQYPGLGLVTVYRTLEKLEELGLVQRVHGTEGCHSYIAAAEGHQHLLICTSCNRAEYFSGDDLNPLMADLGSIRGFQIQEHWLQLFGTCKTCQRNIK